jgi:o-succinylbenzoate synthase
VAAVRIDRINIYEFSLPLLKPLELKGVMHDTRKGLLIKLTDDTGAVGWGECSPLPEFSAETVDDIMSELKKLRFSLQRYDIPDNLEELSGGFERWLDEYKLSASARFGFESAVLSLLASERGIPVRELLSDESRDDILINGLVTARASDIRSEITRLVEQGYRTIKLKVGRATIAEDIQAVSAVLDALPHSVTLRLDANRAWSFEDAYMFARTIDHKRIAYIEEPLVDSTNLPRLYKETGVLIALDESLLNTTPERLQLHDGTAALVLKPTLLGGLETAMKFARRAIRSGIKAVVSSSFESSLGLRMLAEFAASLGDLQTAHGLDTAGWLAVDTVADAFVITDGRVSLMQYASTPSVNPDVLSEISYD